MLSSCQANESGTRCGTPVGEAVAIQTFGSEDKRDNVAVIRTEDERMVVSRIITTDDCDAVGDVASTQLTVHSDPASATTKAGDPKRSLDS